MRMIKVKGYDFFHDADMAKDVLNTAGMHAELKNLNFNSIGPIPRVVRVELYVEKEKVEEALDLLGRTSENPNAVSELSASFERKFFTVSGFSVVITLVFAGYKELGLDDLSKLFMVFAQSMILLPIGIYCIFLPIFRKMARK